MTDLVHDDPCILFALHREARTFLAEFKPQQRFPGAPCWARFSGPSWLTVLVMVTGVGSTHTRHALDWVLAEPLLEGVPYKPRLVVSAGFGGALGGEYRVGDIVLADEVCNEGEVCLRTTWPGELAAGEWRPPIHLGRLLSVAEFCASPHQKEQLGKKYSAQVVDMESFTVAEACAKKGVPLGLVRAISDDLNTEFSPALAALLASGQTSILDIVKFVAKKPGRLAELWRLARQTRLAGGQLAKALGELLTLTLPFGAEL